MAQAVWTGSLSFGLVNIPVKLYNATSPKDVRFRQFDAGTGRRVRHRRVVAEEPVFAQPEPDTQATEERTSSKGRAKEAFEDAPPAAAPSTPPSEAEREVAYQELMKGYEVERGQYVMVDPEELRELAPERSRAIEIEEFVDLPDIDPVYFEKSYYLAPQWGVGAEKPYWLLLRAMERAGKIGIARFVLKSKEHLAAIRPMQGVIGLETMFYADEVRPLDEIPLAPEEQVSQREMGMAERLIESLAAAWDPARYRDAYRERVLDLVRAKAEGAELVREEEEAPEPTAVPDLMAALKASVEEANKRRRRTG